METGRKFWITAYALTGIFAYGFFAGVKGFPPSDALLSAAATMVLALCGGNAVASIASSLTASKQATSSVSETVTREVTAKNTTPKPPQEPQ